jgi:hypothetical protein
MSAKYIYEVVDGTDDERYYTLGVFLTKEEASAVLDSEGPPNNEDDPDSVTIEVRSRPIGFFPHAYTTIARRTWERMYEDNEPDWKAHPIKFTLEAKP